MKKSWKDLCLSLIQEVKEEKELDLVFTTKPHVFEE